MINLLRLGPPTRRSRIAPLRSFPERERAQLAALVALPWPPPKVILYGGGPCDARPNQGPLSRAWFEWHLQRGLAPEAKRPVIPTAIRRAVFARDGGACRYCRATTRLAADHVLPWTRGGRDTLANLVVACRSCNSRKHARTPEEAGMVLLPPPAVS